MRSVVAGLFALIGGGGCCCCDCMVREKVDDETTKISQGNERLDAFLGREHHDHRQSTRPRRFILESPKAENCLQRNYFARIELMAGEPWKPEK